MLQNECTNECPKHKNITIVPKSLNLFQDTYYTYYTYIYSVKKLNNVNGVLLK